MIANHKVLRLSPEFRKEEKCVFRHYLRREMHWWSLDIPSSDVWGWRRSTGHHNHYLWFSTLAFQSRCGIRALFSPPKMPFGLTFIRGKLCSISHDDATIDIDRKRVALFPSRSRKPKSSKSQKPPIRHEFISKTDRCSVANSDTKS